MRGKLALAVAIIFFSATEVPAQSLPAPSSWENQRKSTMNIVAVDPATGNVKGLYTNNAAGFDCQGVPFDLGGKISGNRVTLIVVWKNATISCDSITVWKGRISGNTVRTKWQVSYVDSGGNLKTLRGADTFVQAR
jgi:Avidin family